MHAICFMTAECGTLPSHQFTRYKPQSVHVFSRGQIYFRSDDSMAACVGSCSLV